MFPLNDSVIRHSASLHWLPRAAVRQFHRYYQSAPTSHRPSRLAPFRSLSGTTDCRSSRGGGELPFCRPLVGTDAGASILRLRLTHVETAGSPRFLDNPFANMPCSSTPADRTRQASKTHPILPSARLTASAPRSVTFRGSITQPVRSLSTLRSSDCSDNTAQDSLPADGHS